MPRSVASLMLLSGRSTLFQCALRRTVRGGSYREELYTLETETRRDYCDFMRAIFTDAKAMLTNASARVQLISNVSRRLPSL